ncbi:hypothetical protein Tco_1406992 [Tanacetum coccineum]
MKNWRLEAIKEKLERITRQQKWDQQINELMKAIEALPVWVGHSKEFEEQNTRSCVKENVALTHCDEEFVHEDPKELSYAQEKVKEDVGLGSGLEAVEKKLEKDGTYSSREQGEDDWQPTSETDLQDIQTCLIAVQRLVVVQGLESHSTMIFGVQLEQHVLYIPLFEQRMIWDPGIKVIKIWTLHLEDKVRIIKMQDGVAAFKVVLHCNYTPRGTVLGRDAGTPLHHAAKIGLEQMRKLPWPWWTSSAQKWIDNHLQGDIGDTFKNGALGAPSNLWKNVDALKEIPLRLKILQVINLKKSNLLGFGVSREMVNDAASSLGCAVMRAPFKYLGVMVGGNMSMVKTWDEVISKLKTRLSKWKCKALSIGGRLTLLKSVLGSTPIYNLSLYKAPKTVLNTMESIRRNFFYGSNGLDTKITWVKWSKILAAKKCGGLGVSSYFALNRALLFKWVWRFISFEKSCWSRVIHAIHGPYFTQNPPRFGSVWGTIVREIQSLNSQGIDLLSFCRIRVGNGMQTRFWKDHWIGDAPLYDLFPRLFSLEMSGDVTVATKLQSCSVLYMEATLVTKWRLPDRFYYLSLYHQTWINNRKVYTSVTKKIPSFY